jgi:bromodomain-containing protein 8
LVQAKDKVTKESKAAKGKTRSSKRGGVKKEDSEPEDEETTMITPRRSGRVKATDKKDKQEDSEMEEPSAVNSAVSSPSPSLSDLGADQVQSHKAWKRAIMLVWRQIAQHKYANLFLQPVRDDDATGYSEVVHR